MSNLPHLLGDYGYSFGIRFAAADPAADPDLSNFYTLRLQDLCCCYKVLPACILTEAAAGCFAKKNLPAKGPAERQLGALSLRQR